MSFDQFYKQSQASQKLFESVHGAQPPAVEVEEKQEDEIRPMFEAVDELGEQLERGEAIAAVIEWAESGDPTADNFDAVAQALADVDDDEDEVLEGEDSDYGRALNGMADALAYLGVNADDVAKLLDGDDKAASKVFVQVSEATEGKEDMYESIAEFSAMTEPMFEAKVKVVRDGKTKWITKPLRKKRLSSAQRAGLKKARMKSNTSAARAKRKRSMKKRKSAGM